MKYKNFKQIPSKKIDVLILDEFGSEWIKNCIPGSATFMVIPLGASIPLLLESIFITKMIKELFIRIIIKLFKRRSGNLPFYIALLVQSLKPKVIISFNDNNNFMGHLQEKFPAILVISVQNGIRADIYSSHGGWGENGSIPHYYGYGDYEKKFMEEKKLNIKEYVKAGSLKLGLALSRHENKNNEEFDICFISQFRHKKLTDMQKVVEPMLKTQKDIYDILAKISVYNKLKISVALTNNINDVNYQKEIDYYREGIDCSHIKYMPNDRSIFSSYQIGFSSKLIITLWSTLSMELFGSGKRVLFGALIHKTLVDKDIYKKLFKHMPNEVLLKKLEPLHIKNKIDYLLEMTDEQYLKMTSFARNHYMRCEPPYPHQLIKEHIAMHLSIPVD